MTITLALAALKTAFQAIDPAPQPDPAAVWVWPADGDSITYTTFPFILIQQDFMRWSEFRDVVQGGGMHVWYANIDICLANGQLPDVPKSRDEEALTVPWIVAAAKVLSANRGLGGQSISLGVERVLFTYRPGIIEFGIHTFWGIRFQVAVNQLESIPAI